MIIIIVNLSANHAHVVVRNGPIALGSLDAARERARSIQYPLAFDPVLYCRSRKTSPIRERERAAERRKTPWDPEGPAVIREAREQQWEMVSFPFGRKLRISCITVELRYLDRGYWQRQRKVLKQSLYETVFKEIWAFYFIMFIKLVL